MSKFRVVDDPGHDLTSANMSPDRTLREAEFAQAVVDRISFIYSRIPEITQLRTKEMFDPPLSLFERSRLANRAGAQVLQSHHSNAAGTWGVWNDVRGFGVYVYPGRSADMKLARIAHKWCKELLLPFGLPDRGIRERNLHMLRETTAPSILFEWAFHSNREDVALLKRFDFRDACAEVSVRTNCEYLGVAYPGQNGGAKPMGVEPLDRNPHSWEVSGLQRLVDQGYLDANAHNPNDVMTKGLFGTFVGRMRVGVNVDTEIDVIKKQLDSIATKLKSMPAVQARR